MHSTFFEHESELLTFIHALGSITLAADYKICHNRSKQYTLQNARLPHGVKGKWKILLLTLDTGPKGHSIPPLAAAML
jgi:hypothetical protein